MKILALKKRFLHIATFLLILLSLIIPKAVNANMAAPYFEPGELIGEPTGDFRNLGIVWEKLNFDLRPLNNFGESTVTAIYQIRNDGEKIPVELLFVSPGIKTSSVTIDGKKIAAETIKDPKLRPTWKVPSKVPTPGGSTEFFVNESVNSALKFKPTIPQGEHQLQVQYIVEPGISEPSIYKHYQFVYILAPAKNWAFFKRLEAWYVSLMISLPPVAFYIGGLIAAGWIGKVTTRKTDELKTRFFIALLLAIPLGVVSFLMLAGIGLYLGDVISNLSSQKGHFGNQYAPIYAILFFLFIGLFISGFIAFISAIFLGRKRNHN